MTVRWQNIDVAVKAEVVPRFFWTTTSIDVYLNGSCVLRTGGVMRLIGAQKINFDLNDGSHTLELSWQTAAMSFGFPYRLSIDGTTIVEGSVFPRNWPALFIPIAAVLAAGIVFRLIRAAF